jgi:4a-hydroxytetrahydrobiopterin dehydratase
MAELLSADEVAAGIASLDGWSGSTSGITRTAALPTFLGAIAVVDRVAAVAEQADHHPDIDIRWRNLTFTCATHSAGGVTAMDLDLARRIDEIVAAAGSA